MNCDNIFCIYWEDEHCTINNISIDIVGNCMNCIYVDIKDDILLEARKRMLRSFDNE